ncbi:hypothetical protein [Stratiformator vulcanicus]|uniref:Uncharacterized protein n=1 Tax=Stratiformator vulcanicus TaxID=2527980 RepID=A0A517R6I5_9PLAN|nr:hypothetical protein [Stratiformator vulcanicus]QDT39490.1 hypothetical protein Pan189_38980 [Stratiformator vulcanicus]
MPTRFEPALVGAIALFTGAIAVADEATDFGRFEEVRRYKADEATQGVAVDEKHFYAIANRRIGKYDRETGEQVASFDAEEADLPLLHMNGGVCFRGLLYVAHSNFPRTPATSSIEVFGCQSLQHIKSHSLGRTDGSMTVFDIKLRYFTSPEGWGQYAIEGFGVFAHYSENPAWTGHGTRHTYIASREIFAPFLDNKKPVRLPHLRRELRRATLPKAVERFQSNYIFPDEVLKRFEPHSCSGGSWGPGGKHFYCTGHDRKEIYILTLPKAGSVLKHVATLDIPFPGQAIAWDRSEGNENLLWGIDRPKREVVVVKLIKP